MTGELSDEVLRALRRIIRATVAYSHRLASEFGLTVPQLVVLREIAARGEASGSDLARAVSVSPATMTGILKRLRERGLVERRRSRQDRRRILESLTAEGRDILADAPPPLQEKFKRRLAGLEPWEQTQILMVLQRIVTMMEADPLDASPILTTDAVDSPDVFPFREGEGAGTADRSPHADGQA